jgi:hypothetical protein
MTTMTTMPADDQRLDRLLAALDPGGSLSTPAISRPLDELALRLEREDVRDEVTRELAHPTSRTRSRRVRWTIAGLLVVILGVFGGIPAASAVSAWLAHTHTYGANFSPTKSGATRSSDSDSSEWLGLNAPDINKALATLYPSYLVMPSGVTKDDAIRTIIRLNKVSVSTDGSGTSHVYGQVTLVRETYESFAECAWYGDWLTADTAGDTSRLQTDDAGLAVAAVFPATVAASPTITPFAKMLARGAAAGDRADVEKGYQADACADFMKGLNP